MKLVTSRKISKKSIVIGICLLCLFVISFFVYQSYAAWKITASHNFVNAAIGEFEKDFLYTGAVQEYVVPKTGYYEIELWGAGGPTSDGATAYVANFTGAGGSYTKGKIELQEGEKLYFYVGQKTDVKGTTSFNGGPSSGSTGIPGGGATDVRLENGTWNNTASLRSRIMVAGGGGTGVMYQAGTGGGLLGVDGIGSVGPSQITGGVGSLTERNGSFGIGGSGCGGGGGYYGGGGTSCATGASGGSSYISGYAGVNAINSSGVHTNDTIHYSNKYFIDTEVIPGNMVIPTTDKIGYMSGNTSNGHAKIRYTGSNKPERVNNNLNNVQFIKSCMTGNNKSITKNWVEIQAIVDGRNVALGKTVTANFTYNTGTPNIVVDGNIVINTSAQTGYFDTNNSGNTCIVIDLENKYDIDELVQWQYYVDNRIFTDVVVSVSSDNTNWQEIINYPGSTTPASTSQGIRVNAYKEEPTGDKIYHVKDGKPINNTFVKAIYGGTDYTPTITQENDYTKFASSGGGRRGITLRNPIDVTNYRYMVIETRGDITATTGAEGSTAIHIGGTSHETSLGSSSPQIGYFVTTRPLANTAAQYIRKQYIFDVSASSGNAYLAVFNNVQSTRTMNYYVYNVYLIP